jgi:glycosyltransferase involved in cell wall biosynthesis
MRVTSMQAVQAPAIPAQPDHGEADTAAAVPGHRARRRICLVSENLAGPPDEGTKKLALALAQSLARRHDVSIVCTESAPDLPGARLAPAPRSFVSGALRAALVQSRPELLIYIARSSTTFMTFVRSRLLKAYWPAAKLVVAGLQARRHGRLQRPLIRHLAPDLVCVQSRASRAYLEALGLDVELVPSGVDLERFQPVSPADRHALRDRFGLRRDLPVALHVGHLQAGRGIHVLAELAALRTCQVVLVASTSTPQERKLAATLGDAGVLLVQEFQPNVEHWYQLSDLYLFPVMSTDNSIEIPLSVLEAAACDLPIVATRFGGLPELAGGHAGRGLLLVESPAALVAAAGARLRSGAATASAGTRALAAPYSWDSIAGRLLTRALPAEARHG